MKIGTRNIKCMDVGGEHAGDEEADIDPEISSWPGDKKDGKGWHLVVLVSN